MVSSCATLPAKKKDNAIKPKLEQVFTNFLRREMKIGHLRWLFFPIKMEGKNVTLWEKPGLLMAEAPRATMRMSFKTLTSGRLRVHSLATRHAHVILRFTRDGRTNLGDMVMDLTQFARQNYKPGQKQKVAYNLFKIRKSRLEVIDAETGGKPLGEPFLLDAQGDISGLGPRTKFPFHLTAVSPSTTTPTRFDVTGTISNRPMVKIVAHDVPVRALIDYLPVTKWFDGTIDATAHLSKAGIYRFWRVVFQSEKIRARDNLPFPAIKLEGKIHPFAPSTINLWLKGSPSEFDIALHIKDLVRKKVTLSIKSRDAEIGELISWCRTGALMAEGGDLKSDLGRPVIWEVAGKADIQGQFSSVLGPRLLREIDGQLDLSITDGRLTEMPGFVKALSLLSLSYLSKPKDSSLPGLPFTNVHGTIDIKDGVATTRELITLRSPVLNVALTGRVNFPKNVINARIRLGKVWFDVKGPIHNPAVVRWERKK